MSDDTSPKEKRSSPTRVRPELKDCFSEGYLAIASPVTLAEACFAVPAVRALRNSCPQATLILFCPESMKALWETVPEVDDIQTFPDGGSHRKVSAVLRELPVEFDASIAWEESAISISFSKSEIPRRFGPEEEPILRWLTDPVQVKEEPGPIKHRVRHYLMTVEKLGVPGFLPANFAVPPRPEQPEKPRVLLVPGSDFGPSAEWSMGRFVTIAQAIIDNDSHELFILPCPDHAGPAHKLASYLTGRFKVFEEDLTDTLELLATSEALIGCDGSVPHLAAHVGTQCITIFGPNEPEWKRPLGKIHQSLREQVPCSPCLLSRCPLDRRCQKAVTVQDVLDALNAR